MVTKMTKPEPLSSENKNVFLRVIGRMNIILTEHKMQFLVLKFEMLRSWDGEGRGPFVHSTLQRFFLHPTNEWVTKRIYTKINDDSFIDFLFVQEDSEVKVMFSLKIFKKTWIFFYFSPEFLKEMQASSFCQTFADIFLPNGFIVVFSFFPVIF